MTLSLENCIQQKLMIAFDGHQPPAALLESLAQNPVGGITLFRQFNVENPAQVRELTSTLQKAARQNFDLPLLIAVDQEGGQLNAIGGGATQFPGNLALGAADSLELTYLSGLAIGHELLAMGINVNYAPVCDILSSPSNPAVGLRSFGEDPQMVSDLCTAMVTGLQAAGVAATAKHFLGHGGSEQDSHYGLPVVSHSRERLQQVEMLPFIAAIEAGVQLVMTAHVALPSLHNGALLPATLSPVVIRELLRNELGFTGLVASDALDMHAIEQGSGLIVDAIAAAAAGVDLLLLKDDPAVHQNVAQALLLATRRGLLSERDIRESVEGIQRLKGLLSKASQPSLDVVGCAEHQALALEIASQAVTLIKDDLRRLPLRLSPDARLAVLVPSPADLTPADTSSYEKLTLARFFRRYHSGVDEFSYPIDLGETEVAGLRERVKDYDLVIVGTINAFHFSGQAALVNALQADGMPLLTVALRMPHDILAYPNVPTQVCTYGILPPSIDALARALWGEIPLQGQLPVSLPGLESKKEVSS